MIRRPPRSTRTDSRFPYTTLCRSDALLLGVLRRRGLVSRTQLRPVWLDEVGDGRPLAAVPLLQNGRAATLVVAAGDLHRAHQAGPAGLVYPLLGAVETLHAPLDLLAGGRLVVVLAPRQGECPR